MLELLFGITDSYSVSEGKDLPLGNQTSQWFAILYPDRVDRFIKETLKIKYYTRYMDDMILVHHDKDYLKQCLAQIQNILKNELYLETNAKTQIFPIKNGVDYLGFHFYMTASGKIIRKDRRQTKKKYRRKIKQMQYEYSSGTIEFGEVKQVLNSYRAHLAHGNCYRLQSKILSEAVFVRRINNSEEV